MAGALGSINIGDLTGVIQAALGTPVQPQQLDTQGNPLQVPMRSADQAMSDLSSAPTPAPAAPTAAPQQGALGNVNNAPTTQPKNLMDTAKDTKPTDKQPGDEKLTDGQKMYHEHVQQMKDDERRLEYLAHNNIISPAQYEAQRGMLNEEKLDYAKEHPWGSPVSAHPGALGKILHVVGRIADVAGSMFGPTALLEMGIPGTNYNNAIQQQGALSQINEGTKAAAEESAANTKEAKTDEWEAHGEPFLMDGQLVQEQTNKKGEARTVPVSGGQATPGVTAPTTAAAGTAPAAQPAQGGGALGAVAPQGALGSVAPTANKPPVIQKLGEKVAEEDKPAEASALQDVNAALQSPYLTDPQRKTLSFPDGAKPTKGEVKERIATIDRMNEYARQGKQDEFNNEMKKIAAQTSQQLAQLNIKEKEDKLQKGVDAKTQASNSDYYNLYDQDQYHDDVKAWHASGSFAKDSGLVNSKLNPEHGSGGGGGGLGLGLIAKTPATMIGAMGIETVMSQASSILEGYKQAAISAGISTEGQEAIQSFTQAVLSRIQFDMTHMGAKASTLRMRELMRLAVQNVPPPDLQEKDFDNRFQEYRARMEAPIKANTPQGFVPPANPYQQVNDQRKQDDVEESKARGGAPKGSQVIADDGWITHHTPGIPDFPKDSKGLVQDPNGTRTFGYIGYLDKDGKFVPFPAKK